MKSFYFLLLAIIFSLASCENLIKNENAKIDIEEGTKVENSSEKTNPLIGNYVGDFVPDFGGNENKSDFIKYSKAIAKGDLEWWTRENKISISIDEIKDSIVNGHSVVAGNDRPFEGTIIKNGSSYLVKAKEPGSDKYDGEFTFTINDTLLKGKWKAFAKIDIQNRKYELVKKEFVYDANVMLDTTNDNFDKRFIDWTKPAMSKKEIARLKLTLNKDELFQYEEFEENTDFASATENIYKLNSSTILLKEVDVSNMKRGDIYILRNTIYARHGFSFKYRPLRVFFDRQSWYVPFSANIKNELTDIEKQNIQLLLKYEKNAKEYYDSFGRG